MEAMGLITERFGFKHLKSPRGRDLWLDANNWLQTLEGLQSLASNCSASNNGLKLHYSLQCSQCLFCLLHNKFIIKNYMAKSLGLNFPLKLWFSFFFSKRVVIFWLAKPNIFVLAKHGRHWWYLPSKGNRWKNKNNMDNLKLHTNWFFKKFIVLNVFPQKRKSRQRWRNMNELCMDIWNVSDIIDKI